MGAGGDGTHVGLTTEELGRLEWDPSYGAYVGTINWCETQTRLILGGAGNAAPEHILRIAVSLFQEQSKWQLRIGEFAADELLILKNQNWLDEGEVALSREEFLSRMQLIGIRVDEDGTFIFSFDDDDMFWGHNIVIVGDMAAGLRQADLAG